jgi:hypothetical protein
VFRSQRLVFTFVLTIISAGGGVSAASTDSAYAAAGRPIRWLFSPPGVAALAADAGASQLLDGTQPFVITTLANGFAVPRGWNAVPLVSFKSFAAIANALKRGALASNVKGIIYDNENWPFTPEEEQRNPAYYEKLSADLVHAHGLLFLTAPAVDLVAVLAPADRKRRYEAYLRLGIAADAARYADAIDIQAQSAEANTELYTNFVRQAAAQARQANPKVVVLAGISTNPNGQHVTADDILRAIAATRDVVDGYWCNIPQPGVHCPHCNDFRPDIAIEVLRSLAGR